MRVFLSSVRKGLEEERDALPGIIAALGHEVIRFEDFSAQDVPSREACLSALAEADICLILLGPQYGHRFEDTGNSPTHEEWVAASTAGTPRVVYRKMGVEFEPEQQALARMIGDYTSGVFHDSFATTPELLTKVAGKIKELESVAEPLKYEAVDAPPHIEWRSDFEPQRPGFASTSRPMLEVHVVPLDSAGYSRRVLTEVRDSLAGRLRRTEAVAASAGLHTESTEVEAVVHVPEQARGSWDSPQKEQLRGVRVGKSGQLSAWSSLPHNSMVSVLDPARLPTQIADLLRMIGNLNVVEGERLAIGAGVDSISMLTTGTFDESRSSDRAFNIKTTGGPLRIEPDESVSPAALSTGATEAASYLARALIEQLNSRR